MRGYNQSEGRDFKLENYYSQFPSVALKILTYSYRSNVESHQKVVKGSVVLQTQNYVVCYTGKSFCVMIST